MIPNILNKEIFFDEKEHKYSDKNGNPLLSVTQLIDIFSPKFDPDGSITVNYAAKHGKSVERVRTEWDKKKNDACIYGTSVHKSIENYILSQKIDPTDTNKLWVNQFKNNCPKGILQSETIVADFDWMLAGTVDLICFLDSNVIQVLDFKTNEKLEKFDRYGNKMCTPLENYFATTFFKYELQIGIYSLILERMGYFVQSGEIYHFNKKNGNLEIHPVVLRIKEASNLINFWLKNS